jgi:hypothetical protein
MSLTPQQHLALSLDPTLLFTARGWTPDPWQAQLLRSTRPRILLNCSRQGGKSTAVAAVALHTALFRPRSLVLLVSRVSRQSGELFRKVIDFYRALDRPVPSTADTTQCLELTNGSRVISLPGDEDNIRCYSGVALLVVDEAARVPDEVYGAVRPMLAVSGGRLICLSTPNGRQGFFYEAWTDTTQDWERFEVPAVQVPRIAKDYLDREWRTCGPTWCRQEYGCSFETREGLVYPDLPRCVVDAVPPPTGQLLGGLDFGVRDPTAAVWGFHDKATDVLWLTNEFYKTGQSLQQLTQALPRSALWHADPSAALQIRELHRADFHIRKAENAIQAGIQAVTARIESGRLKILRDRYPNLLAEGLLYQYDKEGDQPIDKHNHALDALRYLVASLDRGFLARVRRTPSDPPSAPGRKWLSIWNEELWTRMG